jgi:hypothetical protein
MFTTECTEDTETKAKGIGFVLIGWMMHRPPILMCPLWLTNRFHYYSCR